MKTITIQIGNSDDKLTQKQWSEFVEQIQLAIVYRSRAIHFFAASHGAAQWQNAAWVAEIKPEQIEPLRAELCRVRASFQQESVAFTIGETAFV